MLDGAGMASKPWLTPAEQVQCLKNKGVVFELMSEAEAEDYLRANNNYFRVASYRHGFPRVVGGENDGKYINLDFAMLQDLSVIDYLLRKTMLPITIDVENYAKMELLRIIEVHKEDGYQIVQDFLDSETVTKDDGTQQCHILNEIQRGSKGVYTNKLIERYENKPMPIWGFLELIPFGTFSWLWRFCAVRFNSKSMQTRFYQLQDVKGLRNACAHNNCILNGMESGTAMHAPTRQVISAVQALGISDGMRKSKLSNARLMQLTTTLFLHHVMCSSGIKDHVGDDLSALTQRMSRHPEYYKKNDQIRTSFAYLHILFDRWYDIEKSDEVYC